MSLLKNSAIRPVLSSLLVSASVLATGCDNPSVHDLADRGTRELGVPVMMWAEANDPCVLRLLRKLYNDEYSRMNDQQKRELRERFQATYDVITIHPSEDAGQIGGAVREIRRLVRTCADRREAFAFEPSRHCTDSVAATKTLDGRMSSERRMPENRVEMRNDEGLRELSITLQRADERSERLVYEVADEGIYNWLNRENAAWLDQETAGRSRRARLVSKTQSDPIHCGQLPSLNDLF